ncbi:MAG: ThiF family adenylyltransferase [Chloroflexota bacterium]
MAVASRAGPSDLTGRVPELRGLSERGVALFGLGALGAPAALEFARAGVGDLRVVDSDIVEAGNTVRWPLGMTAVGYFKAEAVLGFVSSNYPYTNVTGHGMRVGAPRLPTDDHQPSQLEMLNTILEGIDLVFDATAEPGVWHVLSDLAREREVPYVHVWATPGAWGGAVARVLPDRSGCWVCIEHHYQDGTFAAPHSDPVGETQPAGCADPTFTGANFDLQFLSLLAVRTAVSTLSRGTSGAYPDTPWDVAVINLREPDGTPTVEVHKYQLDPHPACRQCGS